MIRSTLICSIRNRAFATAVIFALTQFFLLPPEKAARAQEAAPSLPPASAIVEPAVSELRSSLDSLRIGKWKAPGPVRDEAEQNIGSIHRDLDATLPALVAQADASPRTVANAFAVYRNLDALYEVLLRVSGTAELAAPEDEAASLSQSLRTLDGARRSLADSILSASRAEDTALAERRTQAASPAPPVPQTTVIDDGPTSPAATHRKAKPKTAPKAAPKANPGAAPSGA